MQEIFETWPKTKRLNSGLHIVVTEKIDGTNAQVNILDDGETMLVGSRNKYITPDDDNAGFARWCEENREDLLTLGPGRHYGEWYGQGIQRRYGLDHKRFALFNAKRWTYEHPPCCHVVPTLYDGLYQGHEHLLSLFDEMKTTVGSYAVPGWERPEGLWVFFAAFQHSMKMPLDK